MSFKFDLIVAPHHVGTTRSRQIPEVKQRRAQLVLGRVTTWEHRVCYAFMLCFFVSILHLFHNTLIALIKKFCELRAAERRTHRIKAIFV